MSLLMLPWQLTSPSLSLSASFTISSSSLYYKQIQARLGLNNKWELYPVTFPGNISSMEIQFLFGSETWSEMIDLPTFVMFFPQSEKSRFFCNPFLSTNKKTLDCLDAFVHRPQSLRMLLIFQKKENTHLILEWDIKLICKILKLLELFEY